jgi:RNA 2',3'-cyclic 3'-phosphodiesterase
MPQGSFDFGKSLSGESRRAEYRERIFFCVLLGPVEAQSVDRYRRGFCDEHRVDGTFRGTKRLHISLHSAGDYPYLPSRVIYAAKLAGQAVAVPSFDVALNAILTFTPTKQGRRPLVLLASSAGLIDLQGSLGSAMREVGFRTKKHFNPHVTVLYGPTKVAKQEIEPIRFVVNEFCFVHSEIGRSRYNIIARWPLRG